MFNLYFRRLLSVVLWLLLSISSLRGWKYLSALKPEDPPIWRLYDYAAYLAGSWPFFLAVMVGLVALYVLELIDHKPAHLPHTLFWVALFGLAAIAVYPFGSHDNFGYVAYTHLHAYYGFNPYQATVADVSGYLYDPFLKNMWWIKHGSPYGPLWTWLAYGLYYMLSGFGLIPLIFGFKMLGLLMHLLITVVIYRIAEVIANGRGPQAAVLYGLNPFAIFELVANAHNDGMAILLLLVSLLLVLLTRHYTGFFVAGMAVAFKLTAGLAAPYLLWKIAKEKGLWYARLCAVTVVAIIVLLYLPFRIGAGGGLIGLQTTLSGYISNSLATIPYAMGYEQLINPVRFAGILIYILCYIWLLQKSRTGKRDTLILAMGFGFLTYYFFGATVVHRWYYLWPLALMASVPNTPWTKAILAQSMLLLLSYTFVLALGEGNVSNACTYLSAWVPLLVLGISRYCQRNHNRQFSSKPV